MDTDPESPLLRKDQLEMSLYNERQLVKAGELKEDNPLDLSEPFHQLCEACRNGDLKVCQEKISEGVNINGRDLFDYTPLILASLCGHYEVVQLLLDSGALCERDTFQGERCLYNALNDKIRNLLLQYEYSKSTDPLQPLAAHIISLLSREIPRTSDIEVISTDETFHLHKFILSARSPYFHKKLAATPTITSWKLPSIIPPQAFGAGIRYLYFGEAPRDLKSGLDTEFTESEIFAGIDRIAKQLELPSLVDTILDSNDRRLARQRRAEEVEKGRDQMEIWFRENVIAQKVIIDTDKVDEVRWGRDNSIFADVLLRADEDPIEEAEETSHDITSPERIPIGPNSGQPDAQRKSTLFPVHRGMLLRSEFFLAMFSSDFREAQITQHLQIIPIDCSPEVLEVILTYLYTEKSNFPLEIAVDVLFAADLLLLERLKTKAAVIIGSLGTGDLLKTKKSQRHFNQPDTTAPETESNSDSETKKEWKEEEEEEPVDVYDIIRAGWLTRVQRLEEFAARYLAYRLESHIDRPEFQQLVYESSQRIEKRQETDSIELVDDIRYYLSERFRLRFEGTGIGLMESSNQKPQQHQQESTHRPEDARIIPPPLVKTPDPATDPPSWATSPARGSSVATPSTASSSSFKKSPILPQAVQNEATAIPDVNEEEQDEATVIPDVNEADSFGKQEGDGPVIRTLDGEVVGDEFARDEIDYRILLEKLDNLLERLNLEA
ncbi:hypothetical protein FQN57_003137 [Myotisia sp. PD_48]|nr:hypothetical protein FQN57_003137 [Myotisia sp. PD_48]